MRRRGGWWDDILRSGREWRDILRPEQDFLHYQESQRCASSDVAETCASHAGISNWNRRKIAFRGAEPGHGQKG